MARALPAVAFAAIALVLGLALALAGSFDPTPVAGIEVDARASASAVAIFAPLDHVVAPDLHAPPSATASGAPVSMREAASAPFAARRAATSPRRISGIVLGGRTGAIPLEGATILLWRERDAVRTERRASSDADGRFAIEDVGSGGWFADVSAVDHGDVRRGVFLQPDAIPPELEIELPVWREITFQLVGSDGPIRDLATIGLDAALATRLSIRVGVPGARGTDSLDAAPARGPRTPASAAVPGSVGRFEVGAYVRATDLAHLLIGHHVIASRPMPDGDDERVVPFRVDLADVRRVARPLALHVFEIETGLSLADADVDVRFVGGGSGPATSVRTLRTDAMGLATWSEAPPLAFDVRPHIDGFVAFSRTIPEARSGVIELGLHRSRRLAGKLSAAIEGERVAIWKMPADGEALGSVKRFVRTQPGGAFDFGSIAAGTYALAVPIADVEALLAPELGGSRLVTLVTLSDRDVTDAFVPWVAPDPSPEGSFGGRKAGGDLVRVRRLPARRP